jgi:hypothetical protein
MAHATAPAIGADTNRGPRIEFAETKHDFGRVESGRMVKHDFVFTNTGSALLEITNVRTSCGCTTPGAWDRRVAPGKSGIIPVQFSSAGYGGPVTKMIVVFCNDPAQTNVTLRLEGTIWKPIDVMPAYAVFNLQPEVVTNEVRVIRIRSNLEEPVFIYEPTWTNRAFQAALKTVREGREFELAVDVVAPLEHPGITSTTIELKTSSPKMPLLTVAAHAVMQAAVIVTPAQVVLPAGPLTNRVVETIKIMNNTTHPLVLSEPSVNAQGVELEVREMQPGRLFNLDAVFPVGYLIPRALRIELRVRSNQPQFEAIRVPVVQSEPLLASPTTATAALALKAVQEGRFHPAGERPDSSHPATQE